MLVARRFPWWRLVFVCAMLVAIAAKGAVARRAVVAIESGKVEVFGVASLPQGGAFLGIPYAARPVGDLRWKAPQAADRWEGVRSAKAYGPACPQEAESLVARRCWGGPQMATDEACLFLNVWTPDWGLRRSCRCWCGFMAAEWGLRVAATG